MNLVYPQQKTILVKNQVESEIVQPTLSDILSLSKVGGKALKLDFDGGALSSDAGLLLLGEVERQIGLIKGISELIDDRRDARYIDHSVKDLLMQRIGQIACGYEDGNDCNELRHDPILKLFANRLPDSGAALASQPTMSRFENSISGKTLYKLAYLFAEQFIHSYDEAPEVIILDFDDTENTVYGDQQLSLFNAYYGSYCYLPLHVYEGISGKLVTTILKPGRSDGKLILAILKRMVELIRSHWPNTLIIFRGDGHFSAPEVMEYIDEQEGVMFVSGLSGNSVLKKLAAPIVERAQQRYEKVGCKVTLFHSVRYKAGSWQSYRRVVIKVEVCGKGVNVRYVVTDMQQAKASVLYKTIYADRGKCELYIKDHKLHLKSDRTSCHHFEPNQFRLLLHSAAYVLTHTFREEILKGTQLAKATMKSIQLKLFKIGAKVKEMKTRVKIELASAYPLKEVLCKSIGIFQALAPT